MTRLVKYQTKKQQTEIGKKNRPGPRPAAPARRSLTPSRAGASRIAPSLRRVVSSVPSFFFNVNQSPAPHVVFVFGRISDGARGPFSILARPFLFDMDGSLLLGYPQVLTSVVRRSRRRYTESAARSSHPARMKKHTNCSCFFSLFALTARPRPPSTGSLSDPNRGAPSIGRITHHKRPFGRLRESLVAEGSFRAPLNRRGKKALAL